MDRNRLKRRLRELLRLRLLPSGSPTDVVVWAQRGAYDLSFDALAKEVDTVRQRLDRFTAWEGS